MHNNFNNWPFDIFNIFVEKCEKSQSFLSCLSDLLIVAEYVSYRSHITS